MKNKSLKIVLGLSGALILSACAHENPVMKTSDFETLVGYITDNRFMSQNQQTEVWICPVYFADPEAHTDNKSTCEKWMNFLYEKETGDFEAEAELTGKPYTKATREDFRDPKLWEAVLQKLDATSEKN